MQGAVTEERIRVRYGETDQMGHAYYANYLFWFEQARGAWCRDRGFTYKQMEELGYFLPVVEAHVKYAGEVKYDDWITVRIWTGETRRASVRFDYEIVNETTGQTTTTGYTWHVFMNGETRRASTVPDAIREWIGRDPAQFERLP
jgi:acyl-CoA thioester hydrolase